MPVPDNLIFGVAIGATITDAEGFAGSINTVVERLDSNTSDLDILMPISIANVQSAREMRGAMRELGERLASMLSGSEMETEKRLSMTFGRDQRTFNLRMQQAYILITPYDASDPY